MKKNIILLTILTVNLFYGQTKATTPKIRYNFTVNTNTFSPILEQPDMVNSATIGNVENNTVTVLDKTNDKYYFVRSGNVQGFLFCGWIYDNQKVNLEEKIKNENKNISNYEEAVRIENLPETKIKKENERKAKIRYEENRKIELQKLQEGDAICFAQGFIREESFLWTVYSSENYNMNIICYVKKVVGDRYQIRVASIKSNSNNNWSYPKLNGIELKEQTLHWIKPNEYLNDNSWHKCN